MTTLHRARTSRGILVAGRIAGAALTGWSAGIHLYLWTQCHRDIATIGPLLVAAEGMPTRRDGEPEDN